MNGITPAELRLFQFVRTRHPDLWRAALAQAKVQMGSLGFAWIAPVVGAIAGLGGQYMVGKNQRRQLNAQLQMAREERLAAEAAAANFAARGSSNAPGGKPAGGLPNWVLPAAGMGAMALLIARGL